MAKEILDRVREAARKRILFLPHAVRQMSRPDRMIAPSDVRRVIAGGDVIEDYPEDVRGHSCLLLGFEEQSHMPIHVVCSPKEDYLAVITAYRPETDQWSENFRRRR